MGTFLDEKDGNKGQNMTEKTDTQEPASKGVYLTPEKPLDLGSVDSDLFSAILSGEVEFVRSRFRGNDRMSDAEAILMIRTRRAEEEKVHAKQVAASQFEHAQEDPSKKVGAAFFGGMTYDSYMRNMSRPDDGKTRQGVQEADLFGGFIMANGNYRDAFGGTYDQYGYEYANGNYKSASGDLFDMAKGIITLADGVSVVPLMAGLEKDGASVLKMTEQVKAEIAQTMDNLFSEGSELGERVSLAGKLVNTAGTPSGDDIKPSASALEAGAPVTGAAVMAASATPTGMAAIAESSAQKVAVSAVAAAMGDEFAKDEAFRAAASFDEGAAVCRLKHNGKSHVDHVHIAQMYVWRNKQAGMDHENMGQMTHEQRKELRDLVKGHAQGVVESILNDKTNMMNVSTALQTARDSFLDNDDVKKMIGKIVGTPEAGSVTLNLGKKPAAFRP
jgi:hypothetical protein